MTAPVSLIAINRSAQRAAHSTLCPATSASLIDQSDLLGHSRPIASRRRLTAIRFGGTSSSLRHRCKAAAVA
jgi:hypothetical protein